jgi:hypothetical protein
MRCFRGGLTLSGATQGKAAIGPNKPDSVRRTISVFGFGHGNFLTKLAPEPLSPMLCRPKLPVLPILGNRVEVIQEGWPVTRHIRSSDPRILTRKCCDRFRSVCAYWVVSQRALWGSLACLKFRFVSSPRLPLRDFSVTRSSNRLLLFIQRRTIEPHPKDLRSTTEFID